VKELYHPAGRAAGLLDKLPEELRTRVVEECCSLLAPVLRDEEGNWVADYVRLRFLAWR